MSEDVEADTVSGVGLLGPEARPTVLVLGAGGLARRLVVGALREHGLTVHETRTEAARAAGSGLSARAAGSGETGATIDLRGAEGLVERWGSEGSDGPGDSAGPASRAGAEQPTVGLLITPTTDHWNAAASHGLPLVVLLLERPSDEGVADAVLRGADAVVTAHDEPEELVTALAAVASGGTVLTPHQVRWIADAARGRRREGGPVDALTRRELDILLSINRGETVKQTARSLGISAKTVENLQSRLFRKLAVRNRAQAVSRAHALGLLNAGSDEDLTAVERSISDGRRLRR
jgi:DNA-binding NarL/FixJ family response regulator